ncbi:MAG TPA: nucleotidyltransferase domain-containing protein [Vicinamibacterales bacterium]|jgi:predicted nucleotidyltransferase|nr:nucleotidyltransferase domain-containing protein [Vicinamibacterales bacterium]
MPVSGLPSTLNALTKLAGSTPGLEVLLVFGSRGRGDAHAGSDWDLGYIASADFDAAALLSGIVEIVGSDRVDLVNLSAGSGLLRHRAARDGHLLFEASPRLAEQFRLDASQFWCDAAPVLSRGYDELLEELPR